jgi:hypothetical protein
MRSIGLRSHQGKYHLAVVIVVCCIVLFKYFENKLIEGRLIQKIFILNGFQDNTDWVEIEFGEKDAAISKFSFPKSI